MKKVILFLLFILAGLIISQAQSTDAEVGKSIFTQNCTSCHAIEKEVVGPALKDVEKRRTEAWIVAFVHSPQKMISSGDTTAINLFDSHNKILMPNHPGLKDADIKNILAYIKLESEKVVPAQTFSGVDDNPAPYPGKYGPVHQLVYLDLPGGGRPVSLNDRFTWTLLFTAIILLLVSLVFAVKVQGFLQDYGKIEKS